jgi:hypothetical protein
MTALLSIALLAASLPGSYDCTIEHQVGITEAGANNQQIMFPQAERDNWRFAVRVPEGRAPTVAIEWPADPIQIAGRHPSIDLAPGQVAMFALSQGPCMFTEGACMAMVELSARDDGSLGFSVLPAGSSRQANGTRTLLHVVFLGTCRRHGGAAQ